MDELSRLEEKGAYFSIDFSLACSSAHSFPLAQTSMATFLSPHSPSESLFWILPSLKFVLALSPSPTSSPARFLLLGSFSPSTIFLLTSHSLNRQHLLPDSPFSRLPPSLSVFFALALSLSLLPPRQFTFYFLSFFLDCSHSLPLIQSCFLSSNYH